MSVSKSNRSYKRKNIYIEKNFQRNFVIKFCSLMSIAAVLTMAVVYWLAMNSTTVVIKNAHVMVHSTAEYLFPLMVQTVLLELVIVSVAVVVLTLIFSFRIAGPLYRFKMMLQGLSQGDFSTPMNLRSDDQLKDLAQAYNETIIKLNSRVRELKNSSSLEEIKKELEKFKTS